MGDEGDDRGGGDRGASRVEDERDHGNDRAQARAEPGGDRCLRRVARVLGGAELFGGQDFQHRVGLLGEPGGELIGGGGVDALELIEERQFLLLLFGVLGDLLALPLDVGFDHLSDRTLGQEGSRGHRKRRRDCAG